MKTIFTPLLLFMLILFGCSKNEDCIRIETFNECGIIGKWQKVTDNQVTYYCDGDTLDTRFLGTKLTYDLRINRDRTAEYVVERRSFVDGILGDTTLYYETGSMSWQIEEGVVSLINNSGAFPFKPMTRFSGQFYEREVSPQNPNCVDPIEIEYWTYTPL